MPLVFTAITSHSPALLPGLGSSKLPAIASAINNQRQLIQHLVEAKPEILLIVSSHGQAFPDQATLNISTSFTADFSGFGDMASGFELPAAVAFGNDLETGLPNDVRVISQQALNHGFAMPLVHLGDCKPAILPLTTPDRPLAEQFVFGQLLGDWLQNRLERVAVLTTGDLSHRLSHQSPAGYSPKAKWFDKKVLKAIENNDIKLLDGISADLAEDMHECILKPLTLTFGLVSRFKLQSKIDSYDHPAGIGWLNARFLSPKID